MRNYCYCYHYCCSNPPGILLIQMYRNVTDHTNGIFTQKLFWLKPTKCTLYFYVILLLVHNKVEKYFFPLICLNVRTEGPSCLPTLIRVIYRLRFTLRF